MTTPAYATPAYRKARAALLAPRPPCAHGCGRPATEADHQPPLSLHRHDPVRGGCCRLVPSCAPCARKQGAILAGRGARRPAPAVVATVTAPADQPLDAIGFDAADAVWDVPWLDDLRDVPADATWPRLMTPPHPNAVGSWGSELADASRARTGLALRWWQRLAAARLLEYDAAGELCWSACDLTVARQVGKSVLLREGCSWRLERGGRFGHAQLIVHTGKDLNVCVEIQRPARRWARDRRQLDRATGEMVPVFKVREANGQQAIELLGDGSRWLVRAQDGAYGLSADMTVVDEAWSVPALGVEEELVPTMVERPSAQLWLISTAHRKATALMINRRAAMLGDVADTDADLWLEWSAPPNAADDDETAWRAASPHWTDRRRRLIAARLAAARAGETDDPDEPDPMSAFRAQWLNRWPAATPRHGRGELLLGAGVWQACAGALDRHAPGGVVALEEHAGAGAAVGLAVSDGAGRFEVDGIAAESWSDAIAVAARFAADRPGCQLIVGARMSNQLPAGFPNRHLARKAGGTETGRGLVLLRNLAAEHRVVHDDTPALDGQIDRARVYNLTSGGLGLVRNNARADLLRAVLWALDAAQAAPPVPAVN